MTTEKESVLEVYESVVWYNGYHEEMVEWRDKIKSSIGTAETVGALWTGGEWKPMEYNKDDMFTLGQLQVLWMGLVAMFGDYGTSPRFGWIDNKQQCVEFLDKVIALTTEDE